MSYFEIGVYRPLFEENIGTLWRSAQLFGAAGIFTIEGQYRWQPSNTLRTERNIPLRCYKTLDAFMRVLPVGATLIGIEQGGRSLAGAWHPKQAIYLLGSERDGLPCEIQEQCADVIAIPSGQPFSLNVAVAGSIVMYERQQGRMWLRHILS
mgnify:CR=1 FL=1